MSGRVRESSKAIEAPEPGLRPHLWRRSFPIFFGGVAFLFVASTAYSNYLLASIDGRVQDIAQNAMPSIEFLEETHSALRYLEAAVRELVERIGEQPAPNPSKIGDLRAEIDRRIQAYLKLPLFPGERVLWDGVRVEQTRLDVAVVRLLAQVAAGDKVAAQSTLTEVLQATDKTKLMVEKTIEHNAHSCTDAALSISAQRQAAARVAYLLDGICILATIASGVLLFRAVQEHTRLVESHNRLLKQRADDLEQFAGRVAHDILSPLQVVSLAIEHNKSAAADPAHLKTLGRAASGLVRVQRIVDGLLDFARSGAPSPGDVATELRAVVGDLQTDFMASAKERNIELEIGRLPAATLACRPGVLISLISNLVRNAIKYMGESETRRIEVRAFDLESSVRVEIEDTGPGLPPDVERNAFQLYVRGKGTGQPGIGLGLATVRRMCEAHAGKFGVSSTIGRGCVFWFELPKSLHPPKAQLAVGSSAPRGEPRPN